ncbi:MAG: DUF2062 domain-containing protein [Deltaproteobacteria bacterium]|nr:DUF2062 domain-containing protein [Deltaproteobacteria bacterium]
MIPRLWQRQALSPRFWWQEFLRQLQELRGKPHEISLGMAIGVFISLTPTIPFHTVLAVSLALIFRASKLAAALGVWLSNPLTIPIFYYAAYKVGHFFLSRPEFQLPPDYSLLTICRLGGDVLLTMLLGGVILGIVPAILAYVLTFRFTNSPRFQGFRQKAAAQRADQAANPNRESE